MHEEQKSIFLPQFDITTSQSPGSPDTKLVETRPQDTDTENESHLLASSQNRVSTAVPTAPSAFHKKRRFNDASLDDDSALQHTTHGEIEASCTDTSFQAQMWTATAHNQKKRRISDPSMSAPQQTAYDEIQDRLKNKISITEGSFGQSPCLCHGCSSSLRPKLLGVKSEQGPPDPSLFRDIFSGCTRERASALFGQRIMDQIHPFWSKSLSQTTHNIQAFVHRLDDIHSCVIEIVIFKAIDDKIDESDFKGEMVECFQTWKALGRGNPVVQFPHGVSVVLEPAEGHKVVRRLFGD